MNYQQGSQRIEIIVRKDSGSVAQNGAKEKESDSVADEKNTTWRTSVFGSENPQRIKRVIKTNSTHALAITKQVADLGIEYYIGGIGNKYGDQAMQEQVSRQYEIVKDYTGFASSVGMGALYGSWLFQKNVLPLHRKTQENLLVWSPDGGIGRRAGLKHQ